MRRIKWAAFFGLALFGISAVAQAQQTGASEKAPAAARPSAAPSAVPPSAVPGTPKVDVKASVDHTAMWVGDRVVFSVVVTCPAGTDILADDLSSDKLKLDGLDLAGSDTANQPGPDDSTIYRFRYYLTSYSVNTPTAKIGPLDVRYYMKRPGQRLEDATPAGEIQVPVTQVAIRSLLPDGGQNYPIRDSRAAIERPMRYRLLESVGIGLVVISIVPVIIFAVIVGQRIVRRKASKSLRQVRAAEQSSLDSVRSTDLSTDDARRRAYAQLNSLVRNHLHDAFGVSAMGLTPQEIGPALSPFGSKVPSDLVTSVLTECEKALYSPIEMLPTAEACRQTVKSAETVLASKR